jgi:hypothetical protein
MLREDTYAVYVKVDGIDLGIWDTFDGGEGDSEETLHRPGGMAPQKSKGGPQTMTSVVVSREYDKPIHDRVHYLLGRRGRAPMIVVKQPLDQNGAAWGRPLVYDGTLKRVSPPKHDSNSSATGMIELEMTTNGPVS